MRALGVAGLMILGAACTSPIDPGGPPPVDLLGVWNYVSSEATSSAVDTGTVTVIAQSGHNFQGSFAVEQSDSSGTHPIAGPVSGQAVDSTRLNFDLFINGTTDRQHLGVLKADTINGSWVENGIASGNFRAARKVGP